MRAERHARAWCVRGACGGGRPSLIAHGPAFESDGGLIVATGRRSRARKLLARSYNGVRRRGRWLSLTKWWFAEKTDRWSCAWLSRTWTRTCPKEARALMAGSAKGRYADGTMPGKAGVVIRRHAWSRHGKSVAWLFASVHHCPDAGLLTVCIAPFSAPENGTSWPCRTY